MNIENIVLNYYPTTTPEMREALWPLKLEHGDFQYVLTNPEIYKTLQVVLAESIRGSLYGWAGIYYRNESLRTIGVFVKPEFRHQGIGGRLKEEAIRICKEQGHHCHWQDTKNGDTWHKVYPDGTSVRA